MMLENFDPKENKKNENEEIMSGVLDLTGNILADTTDNNDAEEIEAMTIQDVVDDISDGEINSFGDIFGDIFDDIFFD